MHEGVVWRQGNELKIRLYDSYYTTVQKHIRLADTIKTLMHLMGVKFNKATHVTGIHQQPLKQRASRNLCGIHVFARAWMIATSQTDNKFDYNHFVVDVMHKYVKALALSGDQKLCYPLTQSEKENNDFGISCVPKTGSPVVVM